MANELIRWKNYSEEPNWIPSRNESFGRNHQMQGKILDYQRHLF